MNKNWECSRSMHSADCPWSVSLEIYTMVFRARMHSLFVSSHLQTTFADWVVRRDGTKWLLTCRRGLNSLYIQQKARSVAGIFMGWHCKNVRLSNLMNTKQSNTCRWIIATRIASCNGKIVYRQCCPKIRRDIFTAVSKIIRMHLSQI